MVTHEKQYRYTIEEITPKLRNVLNSQDCDDPFIRTTIIPRGWKAALLVLRGKLKIRVEVDGTRKAYQAVFQSDYTPDPEGPPQTMMAGAFSNAEQIVAVSQSEEKR